ncbi:putative regulatory protein, FmdB family [Agreia bicolorata]|uniref:FmdB family transcriptional regulator n=1 Tax=Agreia bicolorata TaxID=110935 RepID=A0A1T4YMW7_9MICO|nr:FmdB family zinc ribbon protein [Agreia bicolorata]KJC62922.1 FmdB family transcriptional regulator [Agreia bicolorata]SKB03023.1 putative regulatory protein, FmdB family [Agreia bicolorata]
MPTYSYRCTECTNAFDIHQAFTDDSLTVCPVCGGKLRKVFSAVGVTFNGSGFYRTDSRAGEKSAGTSGSSSTGKASGSGESSSSSTPAAPSTSSSSGGSSGSSSSSGSSGSSTPAASGSSAK